MSRSGSSKLVNDVIKGTLTLTPVVSGAHSALHVTLSLPLTLACGVKVTEKVTQEKLMQLLRLVRQHRLE